MKLSLPVPIEDELAAGIAGRLARLNGLPSIRAAMVCLSTGKHEESEQPAPRIWQLAKVLGIGAQEFSHRHSMLTALFPVSRYLDTVGEADATKNIAKLRGMQTPAKALRFCPHCVQRDIETLGFGIWRRRHQLAGVDFCVVHGNPLRMSSGRDAYQPPSLATYAAVPASDVDERAIGSKTDALNQFEMLMSGWLERRAPIRMAAWAAVVGARCRVLNIRVGNLGSLPTVSDLLKEQMPPFWLQRHLPEVAVKKPAEHVGKVDKACSSHQTPFSGLVCTAILSVLYPSAADATEAMDSAEKHLVQEAVQNGAAKAAIREFALGSGLAEAAQRNGVTLPAIEMALRGILKKQPSAMRTDRTTASRDPLGATFEPQDHSTPVGALEKLQLAPCKFLTRGEAISMG